MARLSKTRPKAPRAGDEKPGADAPAGGARSGLHCTKDGARASAESARRPYCRLMMPPTFEPNQSRLV